MQNSRLLRDNNKSTHYELKVLFLKNLHTTGIAVKTSTLPRSCNLPVVFCWTSVVSSFPDNGAEVQ